MAITGTTAHFRCDDSCNFDVSCSRVTWYKNGALVNVNTSQNRYGLVKDGVLLYLEHLTSADTAEYTCQIQVGRTTFNRSGSLEVVDFQKTNLVSSASCCKSYSSTLVSVFTIYVHGVSACAAFDCGKSCARKPFVAVGVATNAGQFPWQAMLCHPPWGQYCGGVLVSADCIVTAAHCLVGRVVDPKNVTVCLGRQCGDCSSNDPEGNPQCSKPQSVAVHPLYDRLTMDNDIAVIKLRQPPSLDCTSVYPVCLPNRIRDGLYIRAKQQGIVTGWGRVNSTVKKSTCLRKGSVQLVSRNICATKHYRVTTSMVCATDSNGACRGDSGGPLVVKNRLYGGRYVLAGIVSWGIDCGKGKTPGVYTNVLSHMKWIKNTCGIQA